MKLQSEATAIESEAAVLGGVLISGESLYSAVEVGLEVEHFYREPHRHIYRAMVELAEGGNAEGIDVVVLADVLHAKGLIQKVGGVAYLSELSGKVPTSANVKYYASRVFKAWQRRTFVRAGESIAQIGQKSEEITDAQLNEAHQHLQRAAVSQERRGRSIKEALREELEMISKEVDGEIDRSDMYASTGLKALDAMLGGGWMRGQVHVLGARPGMGKTAAAIHALTRLMRRGRGNLFFSLEMSASQVARRILSSESRTNLRFAHTLNDSQLDRVFRGAGVRTCTSPGDIWCEDWPTFSLLRCRAQIRQLQREHERVDLVVGDYLQIAYPSEMEERAGVNYILNESRKIAKETGVAFVWLSQLKRELEQRPDKTPRMADFLGSGGIEAHAYSATGLYRPEYYDPETEFGGMAFAPVLKNRGGGTGKAAVGFEKECTRFYDLGDR